VDTSSIIKKVRKIEIKTRGLSQHVFSGHYHSAFKGRGMTFSEVREYEIGDEIRNIDWNVTARFNHPFIKVFEEERELTVMLLIDVSGSNEFGTQQQFKSELMTEVAAVLAFSAINNNDKVGVIFFSDKIEKFIPPKKGTTHILRIIRELVDYKPENEHTNISEALRFLTNALKKRCTTFLITDFISEDYSQALKIAAGRHDLIALQIIDSAEQQFPDLGLVHLLDNESKEFRWVDTSSRKFRTEYSNCWNKHIDNTRILMKQSGIDHAILETGKDYIKPLMRLFRQREAKY
jgi:uncharacterized protein (DUF58 family)